MKKIISTLIAIAMILSSMGMVAFAADGEDLSVTTSSTITLDGEGYKRITLGENIEVTLVLADGTETTVTEYIIVPASSTLIIEGDTGILNAGNTGARSAGIGQIFDYRNNGTCGTIIINGGVINAYSGYAAAIGGSGGSDKEAGATIIINGGTVNATSNYGAAIGGGQEGAATVTINGGVVNAKSGYGAAIGGGQKNDGKVVISNATVNATSSYGAAIGGGSDGDGEVTIKDNAVVTARATSGGSAIGGGQEGNGVVVIENSNVTASTRNITGYSSPSTAAAIGGGREGNGTVTIKNSTVSAEGVSGAAIGGGVKAATASSLVTFEGENNVTVSTELDTILAIGNPNADKTSGSDAGVIITEGTTNLAFNEKATAVINTNGGNAVLKNADEVVVNVVDDSGNVESTQTVTGTGFVADGDNAVIDLAGATITVSESMVITKDTTIKYGTIKGADGENGAKDPVNPITVNGAKLTLENVKVYGGNLVDANGYVAMNNFADAVKVNDAVLNVIGSELVGGNNDTGYGLPGSAIVAVNSDINVTDSRLATGVSTHPNGVGNGIIQATGSEISLHNTKLYAFDGPEGSHPLIFDSVDSENNPYADVVEVSGDIEVEVDSNPLSDLENIVVPDGKDVNFIGKVDTDTIKIPTKKITVRFDDLGLNNPGDENEDKKVYNIVLVAENGKYINRLNSVDLTFALTQGSWGKNAYDVIAYSDEIVINNVAENRYEFHYDGKEGVITDSNTEIIIGQVEVNGYGEFTFAVDTNDAAKATDAVHTTTVSDNIVDTYIPNGETVGKGNLVIDNSTTGVTEIKVPTRSLKINVAFNNSIENNNFDYQDMKVEIEGEDIDKITKYLGEDAIFENNTYKLEIAEALTLNTAYSVTVSGAGYRTARYTVMMNENKELFFWNNVKDNAAEMEIYTDEFGTEVKKGATDINFLAGDIVKDNIINIYDLSAVVSYFGETGLSAAKNPGYAKYDLNRDGKIDSKDVAYVLVSWGN